MHHSLSSSCYIRNTIDWVANKQQKIVSEVLEAGKSKIKVRSDLVSAEGTLVHRLYLLCPYTVKGVRDLSGVPFIRVPSTFMRALSSLLIF